ncbi:hypothetical protein BOX15_Mlig002171g1, partial [Macrostomum lignano]
SVSTQNPTMKIAIIGQSAFGAEVFKLLQSKGYDIVGVFTIPDKGGKEDILAQAAAAANVPVFKYARWRVKNQVIPEIFEEYKSLGAELNVLPFCSQFIPMEIINYPKHQSIVYHPSILPRHRGASAINWTLIHGDKIGGFSIFWADDGLDTGPVLLTREVKIEPEDTLNSLYKRFLFPEGVKAMGEAVDQIAAGSAPKLVQPAEGATYDPKMTAELAKIDWATTGATAVQLHNFIRGCDRVPGAWALVNGERVSLFGSRLVPAGQLPAAAAPNPGQDLLIEGYADGGRKPPLTHSDGLLLFGLDGNCVSVATARLEASGKTVPAKQLGLSPDQAAAGVSNLTDAESAMKPELQRIWRGILAREGDLPDDLDFFKAGAGSMDVTRLVEEIKNSIQVSLSNEEVYMATTLGELFALVVQRSRAGADGAGSFQYDAVRLQANGMEVAFPRQAFINNRFVDAASGKTSPTVNPFTEEVICEVAYCGKADVDAAVAAASAAFHSGEWGRMNARDRSRLMFRLADLMEAHKEELATIESLDSGAVYTLALKTHIGMSIDSFRYFAGWCDKIHGQTIPINHARPNRNLTLTIREPIGVCGIVTPWNYPLMMLAWKMSACLAAGNTVILKPAQVTPLTSLKFCELVARAGFPPGVVNVLPGPGAAVGQSIAEHPEVRKLGFTGSTPVGRTIMAACSANLKKCSLELGGKSPLIVFADCEFSKAVKMACNGVFFNKGENCIAAGRLFVEASIHDRFVEAVKVEIAKMRIGDPLDRATDHGPQNHRAHLDKLLEYCQRGVSEGAKLVCGGRRVAGLRGFFMEPTLFTGVQDHMHIAQEESFGPVMIISDFPDGDIDGVLSRANATEYGLASGVFTRDIYKALRVSERIHAGTVFVNTYNKTDVAAPFGGFKQSGFGKDLGEEALNEYLKTKTVTMEF